MRKSIHFLHSTLALYLLSSLCALGQERQLELINPDGSVAADCAAIAVITPGVYLNKQLELPSNSASSDVSKLPSSGQIVPMSTNKKGILSIPPEAKAVIAQNDAGFAFVPLNALTGKAKLRPWAKLKIDASAFPEKLRSKYQLRILWQNRFAGELPNEVRSHTRPAVDSRIASGNVDPFGDRPVAPPDWRFNDYATLFQIVDIVDQAATVPPGEVTIVLDSTDSESTGSPTIPLGIVRTTSNQTAEFKLPEFGSAHGQLIDEQGKFTFDVLPIGQYELLISLPTGTKNSDSPYGAAQRLSALGSDTTEALRFVVKAKESTDLGSVAWRINRGEGNVTMPSVREDVLPTDMSPPVEPSKPSNPNQYATTAQTRIEVALNKPVEDISYTTIPFTQVINSLSGVMKIPIVINRSEFELGGFSMDASITLNLPPVSLRSVLNIVLDKVASGELTFVIRDEVLLITTREDAAKHPRVTYSEAQQAPRSAAPATASNSDDGAAEIVERWLQSTPQSADRAELEQLLETHLAAEFDANQQTRRAEIDRLQQLLEQSLTWLDQRQQQREKIIQQRVQELLK